MTFERWTNLMRALGFEHSRATYDALIEAYAEGHRHYHTAGHIKSCLEQLDANAPLAERLHELELAVWFHDAVYRPLFRNNEQKSASWAEEFMAHNAAPAELKGRVISLIMATQHNAPPENADQALLLDIDLSILGADEETYAVYETAIRREFHLVPMPIYRRKRVGLLNHFLARQHIYLTERYRDERERQARANLARAIAELGG